MRRASSGAELTTSPPSTVQLAPASSASKRGPGTASRKAPRSQPADRGAERRRRLGLGADRVDLVGVPGLALGVAQRQHRAAVEVEHRALVLVDGADPQRRQPGRRPPGLGPVLAQGDDLGRGPQRVADPRRPAQRQAAVEEVADHPLGEQRSTGRSRRRRRGRGGRAAARGRAPRRQSPASSASRSRSPRIAWCRAACPSVRVSAGTPSATWPTSRSSKKGAAGAALTRCALPVRSSRRAAAAIASSTILPSRATAPEPAAVRLGQRRQHRLGPLDLGGARGEGVGDRLQLPRVDRPLAVEPGGGGAGRGRAQAVARRRGRSGARRSPAGRGPGPPAAPVPGRRARSPRPRGRAPSGRGRRRGPRSRGSGCRRRGEEAAISSIRLRPGGGLDQRLHPQRPRPAGGGLGAVEQAVGEGQVAGALDLRQHDRASAPRRRRPAPRGRGDTTRCRAG